MSSQQLSDAANHIADNASRRSAPAAAATQARVTSLPMSGEHSTPVSATSS